jgi:plastocyanin
VPTNCMHRTMRMSTLSLLIALMAFSFLAIGSASAHTINHSARSTQTMSTHSTTFVHILSISEFSPSAITVKSGTRVKIVNKSSSDLLLFYSGGSKVLAPGADLMLIPTQSQTVAICAGGTLTITVK